MVNEEIPSPFTINLATYHFAETVSQPPKSPEMSFRAQRSRDPSEATDEVNLALPGLQGRSGDTSEATDKSLGCARDDKKKRWWFIGVVFSK